MGRKKATQLKADTKQLLADQSGPTPHHAAAGAGAEAMECNRHDTDHPHSLAPCLLLLSLPVSSQPRVCDGRSDSLV